MRSTRTVLSLAAVALSWLCIPATAWAQAPAPAAEPGATAAEEPGEKKSVVEEIVVTGSRVRRKDLTTPAPVTMISKEQVTASGKVSIGDFLQTLPEQGNAINTGVNNGGDGSTRVNLRGIGSQYTLVLINGRRMVPGGTGSSADLSAIPTAAIESIEVLKDGASAVYGSDAITGVVNIIMRRGWSGTEATAYNGTSSRGDGQIWDLNFTSGSSSEAGSVLFNASFYNQRKVMAGDRSFSKIPVAYDAAAGEYSLGSGTIPAGRLVGFARGVAPPGSTTLWSDLVTAYPNTGSFIQDPTATTYCGPSASGQTTCWRPYAGAGLVEYDGTGDGYNYAPENYLVTPAQRMSLYASGDTRLGSVARGYFEASYLNRQSGQDLAPEPLVSDGEGILTSAQNAYNPFGVDLYVRRRLVEFGRRTYRQDLDTFRLVAGVDGTLPEALGPLKGWFWDLNANYGRTQGTETKTGNLFTPNLAAAMGPSFNAGTAGSPDWRCGTSAADEILGCVPLNLFGGPGTITPAMVSGLTFTGVRREQNQLASFQANASGELFRLAAERPAGLAVGYEYRVLSGSDIYDPVTAAGLTTGNKSSNTKGSYTINELYGELVLPVVSGMTGLEDLEVSAALRWFDYSTLGVGSDSTYKFGGRWRPVRDVTLRGTYGTAFRAPSISDLYLGQADNFANVTDPCRGPTAPATCGAAANNGDTSTQLRSRVGGNPDLKPETAKIYTFGLVIEPSIIKNLSVTVDYYNLSVEHNIATIGESTILQRCYDGSAPEYCALITRDPTTHFITSISNLNQNVGNLKTAGFDLAVRYALPTDYGRFRFAFDSNFLQKIDQTLADGTVVHGKNTFDLWSLNSFGGTGGTFPSFKFNAGVAWGFKGWGAGVNMRYIGSFHECGDSTGDFSGSGLCYVDSTYQRKVDAYQTYDIFGSYLFPSSAGKTTIAVGMQNVFDVAPAKIYNGFASSTDQYTYDQMGRFIYARLTHNL